MAGVDRPQVALTALALAAAAAECDHLDDVRDHLLPALAHATGGHIAIYHQMTMPPDIQEFGLHWPDDPRIPSALAHYPDVIGHSPLVQHFAAIARPGIATVGELLTRRQWHQNAVYRESHRHLDIEDHLALILGMRAGRIHGITIGRLTGRFEAPERTLLTLLAPHLSATLRRCLASERPYRVLRILPTPELVWATGAAVTPPPAAPALTAREREVLALSAVGLLGSSIARRLDISPRTVDKHLENAYRKLGVTSRFDAIAAMREQARSTGWPHK